MLSKELQSKIIEYSAEFGIDANEFVEGAIKEACPIMRRSIEWQRLISEETYRQAEVLAKKVSTVFQDITYIEVVPLDYNRTNPDRHVALTIEIKPIKDFENSILDLGDMKLDRKYLESGERKEMENMAISMAKSLQSQFGNETINGFPIIFFVNGYYGYHDKEGYSCSALEYRSGNDFGRVVLEVA